MSAEAARQAFEKLYGHLFLSGKDAAWNVFLSGWKARGEQPAPAQQCVCGEPETSGTHRTDGPCYAEQPALDEYKAAYIEAMVASNEAGFSGMTAAETIRELNRMVSKQPAPAQEPDYWLGFGLQAHAEKPFDGATPVWKTPPAPAPVPEAHKPLTDEQLKPLIQKAMRYYGHNPEHWTLIAGVGFCILARDIEAAHGIMKGKP